MCGSGTCVRLRQHGSSLSLLDAPTLGSHNELRGSRTCVNNWTRFSNRWLVAYDNQPAAHCEKYPLPLMRVLEVVISQWVRLPANIPESTTPTTCQECNKEM